MKAKTGKNDFLLLLAFCGIGLVLGLGLLFFSRKGNQVQVRVDGTVVATYGLNESVSLVIHGFSEGSNQLEIHDGMAWVSEASCPDGLCVNMGKISKAGQSVVCLPNHVVVEIVREEETDDPDEIDIIAR